MKRIALINKGYAYIGAWCIISAFSMILTGDANQSIHPVVLCFFSFFFTTAFFLLINVTRLKAIVSKLNSAASVRSAACLNATTFFSWMFLVYPLKYLEPTAAITLIFGVNPIATLLINRMFFPHTPEKKGDVLVSFGLFLSVAYIAWLNLHGGSVVEHTSVTEMAVSIGCCVIAGIATAGNNVFIKDMFRLGFLPKEILSFRFFLSILLTGAAILVANLPVVTNVAFFIDIGLTTVFLLIAPLMLIQLSLRELDPMRVAVISPIVPLFVATFQMMRHSVDLSIYTVFGTVVTWLLMVVSIYVSRGSTKAIVVKKSS